MSVNGAPDGKQRRRGRRRALVIGLAAFIAEQAMLRRRGYRSWGNVVVRCHSGHLFTTIWVPAASFKSLRLLWWRVQRCPAGGHWSLVTPVRRSDLSRRELRTANKRHDIRVP
jgi:hypothetical protein